MSPRFVLQWTIKLGESCLTIKLAIWLSHRKNIAARDALVSLRGLFEFIQWVDYCYGSDYVGLGFDEADPGRKSCG